MTVVSSPLPLGEGQGVRAAEEPVLPLIKRTKPEKKRRIPKWAERLIGHVITLLVFGIIAYLMISHVRPERLPFDFRQGPPAEPAEASGSGAMSEANTPPSASTWAPPTP